MPQWEKWGEGFQKLFKHLRRGKLAAKHSPLHWMLSICVICSVWSWRSWCRNIISLKLIHMDWTAYCNQEAHTKKVNLYCAQKFSWHLLNAQNAHAHLSLCSCAQTTSGHVSASLAASGRGDGGVARAQLEHVLDGGSLWGGLCLGSRCCDWRPTCRRERTQCLLDARHPRPAAQSAASTFICSHIKASDLQKLDFYL